MSDLDARAAAHAERRAERARSRGSDSGRTGYSRVFAADNRPGKVVRCQDCGADVEIAAFLVDLAKLACSALARRGEPPLRWSEVTRCPPCGASWSAQMTADRLAVSAEANRLTAELRARDEAMTDFERTWLKREGYGDFVRAYDDRVGAQESRPARRRREA